MKSLLPSSHVRLRFPRPEQRSSVRIEPLETRIAPAFTALLFVVPGQSSSVSLTGDSAGDTLDLGSDANGLLTHNRFTAGDAGFASNTDFDTSLPGIQSVSAALVNILTVAAGAGDDMILIGDSIRQSALDGGDGSDTYKIAAAADDTIVAHKIFDSGNTGEDRLELTGSDQPDVISIEGGVRGIMMPPGSQSTVDFVGLEDLLVFGGEGDDSITISEASNMKHKFDGGTGSDSYTITFDGSALEYAVADSSNAPTDNDTLTVFGTEQVDAILIGNNAISGSGQTIKFSPGNLDELKLDTRGGSDTITAKFAGFPLASIFGGADNDTLSIEGSTAGTSIKLDGEDGSDTVTIKLDRVAGIVDVQDSSNFESEDSDLLEIIGTEASDVIVTEPEGISHKGERHIKLSGVSGEFEEHKLSTLGGNDSITMSDAPFQASHIDGGRGNDSFRAFSTGHKFGGGPSYIKFDGNEGSDYYGIKFDQLSGQIDIRDSSKSAAKEKDVLEIVGTDEDDAFILIGDGIDAGQRNLKISVAESGLEEYKINGAAGADTFHVDLFSILIGLLVGGQGDDSFSTSQTVARSGIKFDGQDGSDTATIKFEGIAGAVQIKDSGKVKGDNDQFVILGSAVDDLIVFKGDVLTSHKLLGSVKLSESIMHKGGFELIDITGDEGNDRIDVSGFKPAVGTATAFKLDGGLGEDILIGSRGSDFLNGGIGADKLNGGAGPDTLSGGPDDDQIAGGPGFDKLIESGDTDWLISAHKWSTGGTDTADHKLSGAGLDSIAGINLLQITGGISANRMDASRFDGAVILDGGEGDDVLIGGLRDDVFTGGTGRDRIVGGPGRNQVIETGDFDYKLIGDEFTTTMETLPSSVPQFPGDILFIPLELDILSRIAKVTLTGGESRNFIDASDYSGELVVFGLGGDDFILGGTGNDMFSGGEGDDTIRGGGGADTLFETGDVSYKLNDTSLEGLGLDSLEGIKFAVLIGGDGINEIDVSKFTGSATLIGLGGDDILIGGIGPDILDGGEGDDTLIGGKGKNVLRGGPGKNILR